MRNIADTASYSDRTAQIRPANGAAIAEAARLLRAGRLVAFPTETVYGLGADAGNGAAVAAIFAAKERPRFNPLIVHVADAGAAGRIGVVDGDAARLANAFWPGPLTLVVPRLAGSGIGDLVTAGLDTVALRVPAGRVAAALIAEAGIPLAAPSANRSGHVSATTATHVAGDLGTAAAMVLDDGPALVGIESTVIAAIPGDEPRLLRAGAIARNDIEQVLGRPLAAPRGGEVRAPGQLASHYAPRARLRLGALDARPGEVFIAFGAAPAGVYPALTLSQTGDLAEAAANLFSVLRRVDDMGAAGAAVMAIPDTGLGEAINDRLSRAAAPRPVRGEATA